MQTCETAQNSFDSSHFFDSLSPDQFILPKSGNTKIKKRESIKRLSRKRTYSNNKQQAKRKNNYKQLPEILEPNDVYYPSRSRRSSSQPSTPPKKFKKDANSSPIKERNSSNRSQTNTLLNYFNVIDSKPQTEKAIDARVLDKRKPNGIICNSVKDDLEATQNADSKVLHSLSNSKESKSIKKKEEDRLSDLESSGNSDESSLVDHRRRSHSWFQSPPNFTQLLKNLPLGDPDDVAPLHKIETRISVAPTKEQEDEIESMGIPVARKASYTTAEDQIIRDNWLKFIQRYQLPDDPGEFLNALSRSGNLSYSLRLVLIRHLAQGLSTRMLYSVYRRFRALLEPVKRGRYSRKENLTILSLSQKKRRNVTGQIASLLNRNVDTLHVHCRYLKSPRMRWDLNKYQEFLDAIRKVTKVEVEQLQTRKIKTKEWKKIVELMNIPIHLLRKRWQRELYPQLFVDSSLTIIDAQKKMISLIGDVDDKKSINWRYIASEFNGLTALNLNEMFLRLVAQKVPSKLRKNVKDCIEYLENYYFPQETQKTYFKKFLHENGKLRVMSRKQEDREA